MFVPIFSSSFMRRRSPAETVTKYFIRQLDLRFFLCQSLFQCVAAGVEKFMKHKSDDAISVFPLLCPLPSCHNRELEFKRKRFWKEVKVRCHLQE